MELICWDGLRVTRDGYRISARGKRPARLHLVKAPRANAPPNIRDQEPFSPGRRIARIAASIGNKGQRRGGLIGGPAARIRRSWGGGRAGGCRGPRRPRRRQQRREAL